MEQRVHPKDFIAISISFVALIVSLTSAYFTLFWAKDDITVALGLYPGLFLSGQITVDDSKPSAAMLGVSPEQTFTFINNGTRPASIVSISFFIQSVRKLDKKKRDCSNIDDKNIIDMQSQDYSLEPFSIKPGEIAIRKIRLGGPEEKTVWFEPNFGEEELGTIRVYACIEFGIVIPGRNLRHVAKIVALREEKDVTKLLKQDSETFGISRDIQRGPWPQGALIPLVNEAYFFGAFQTVDPEAVDYGLMGCACGDQFPVSESYMGESESRKTAKRATRPASQAGGIPKR